MRTIRLLAILFVAALWTQAMAAAAPSPSQLRMVIVVSRHGVRSPTHPTELQAYAAQTWPAWSGKPGNLTEHGAALMQQFGAYYRRTYGAAGPQDGPCGRDYFGRQRQSGRQDCGDEGGRSQRVSDAGRDRRNHKGAALKKARL